MEYKTIFEKCIQLLISIVLISTVSHILFINLFNSLFLCFCNSYVGNYLSTQKVQVITVCTVCGCMYVIYFFHTGYVNSIKEE